MKNRLRRNTGGSAGGVSDYFRRFRLAIGWSLVSKIISFLLQATVLGVAISRLGEEKFALVAILTGLAVWVELSSFGLGPYITQKFSTLNLSDALHQLKAAVGLTSIVVIFASLCFMAIAGVLARTYGFEDLAVYFSVSNLDLFGSIAIVYVFFVGQLIFVLIERARTGLHEEYINTLFNASGNLVSLVLFVVFHERIDHVVSFLLCQFLGLFAAKACNVIWFIYCHWIELSKIRVKISAMGGVVSGGGYFFVVKLCTLFLHNGIYPLMSFALPASHVGAFAFCFRSFQLASSFIFMIINPLWPIIASFAISGNGKGLKALVLRSWGFVFLLSSLPVIAIYAYPNYPSLLPGSGAVDIGLWVAMSWYFVVWMMNSLNTHVLFALDMAHVAALSSVIEMLVFILALNYLWIIGFADELVFPVALLLSASLLPPLLQLRVVSKKLCSISDRGN